MQENKANSIVDIDGMLTAILSGPKLIPPSKWLESAGSDQIQFNSMEQIKQILVAGVPGYSMTSTGAIHNITLSLNATLAHQSFNTPFGSNPGFQGSVNLRVPF